MPDAESTTIDVTVPDILKKRRGRLNEARDVAIYLTRKIRKDTLKEIGEKFEIGNESTVSSVCERMRKKLSVDRKLVLRLDELHKTIIKSEKRTPLLAAITGLTDCVV